MFKFLGKLYAAIGRPDLRDLFAFGGLGLVGYGVWQLYPPVAWMVVGTVLFWLGVRGHR